MAENVFETGTLDFNIEHGNALNNIVWKIWEPPGEITPYDFSGLTDVYLKIYKAQGKELLRTRTESQTNGVYNTSNNNIEWNDSWSSINLVPGFYYYSLFYEDSNLTHNPVKIAQGTLGII